MNKSHIEKVLQMYCKKKKELELINTSS